MFRPIAFVLVLLVVGTARAQSVSFPSVTVGSSQGGAEIKGWVYRPAGNGPFSAIILAHSCAGVNPHTEVWAKLLVSWGYLVLSPDSFNPRGTRAVCTTPGTVTPNMRVADVAGALDYLTTRPDVVKGKVGFIGHSHGGSTAIRSSQATFGLNSRGLAAAVAYYPGCNPQFDTGIDVPLLLLAGDKDDWTPADRCRSMVSAQKRRGMVDAIYYPDAYHSFDSKQPDRTVPGAAGRQHRLVYDTVGAPDAEARTRAFFAKYLRP